MFRGGLPWPSSTAYLIVGMLERLVARELDYLWGRLARATRNLDALGPLWSRGSDPRVSRIVESAAYFFARVKEKLEDDIPEISHPLVASALPEILRPTPSATIIQMKDGARSRRDKAEYAPRRLESRPIDDVPCVFQTSWPTLVGPVEITQTELRTREPGVQTLTLRIAAYGAALMSRVVPDPLRVYVDARNPFRALDLVHALVTARSPIHVRALNVRGEPAGTFELPATAIRWTALEGAPGLVPGRTDRFASGTALRALHTFPEAYAFFDVRGLAAALATAGPRVHAVELTVRLADLVAETDAVDCLLDCSPAVNVFPAVAAPLKVRGVGSLGVLRAAGHPGAEIFEVDGARLHSARDRAVEIDVRLWESSVASEIWDDELFLRFDRRASIDRGPTELHAFLLRPRSPEGVPLGELHADLLASDGLRTESLLRGDIQHRTDASQIANITRVTPPFPPRLDSRLPWRINAYARMPVMQFATAASLASYVELHDPRRGRLVEWSPDPSTAGVVSVTRRSTHRVERDEVIHGDEVDLVLDESAFGGRGATWLVGELAARAIAERADFLRFTHTRWLRPDGGRMADYARRDGERLPPPFG
jgi:type VI secretion system protein ImpG